MLSLLRALPPVSTVNGSKAIQSVLKEHREEETQYLAVLPKWCWVKPGTVWKLCGRCGGERANVLHPHGQHRGTAGELWFYGSPCVLHCWHESSHLKGKKGVLQLGDEAEGWLRGDPEQLPKSQHLPV